MSKTSKFRLFLIILAAEHTSRVQGGMSVTRRMVSEIADASHIGGSNIKGITAVDSPVELHEIPKLKIGQTWPSEGAHVTDDPPEKIYQSDHLDKYPGGQEQSTGESLRELQLPDSSLAQKPVIRDQALKSVHPPHPLEKPFSSLETYVSRSLEGTVHQENAEKDAARILRNLLQATDSKALPTARQDVRERLLDVFKREELKTQLISTNISPEAWDATLKGLITQFTKLAEPVEFTGFKEIKEELQRTRIDGNLIIWFSRAVSTPVGKSINEFVQPISEGFKKLFGAAANFDEGYDRLRSDFRYVDNLHYPRRDEVLYELSRNLRDYTKGGHPEEMVTDYSTRVIHPGEMTTDSTKQGFPKETET